MACEASKEIFSEDDIGNAYNSGRLSGQYQMDTLLIWLERKIVAAELNMKQCEKEENACGILVYQFRTESFREVIEKMKTFDNAFSNEPRLKQ